MTPEGKVHFLRVQVARDLGTTLDIAGGLRGNEKLVDNPPDTLAEGSAVQVLAPQARPRKGPASR